MLDTPYFTTTDSEGNYKLSGLPVGRYVLKAWISKNNVQEKEVEIKADQTLRVDFSK